MSLAVTPTEQPQAASYVMPPAARANSASPEKPAETSTGKQPVEKAQKSAQKEVEKIVRDINENLQAMHTELNFSVDNETDKMVLKIVNSKTHEVIRQIPAEDALRIASRLSKLLGLLVDENA